MSLETNLKFKVLTKEEKKEMLKKVNINWKKYITSKLNHKN